MVSVLNGNIVSNSSIGNMVSIGCDNDSEVEIIVDGKTLAKVKAKKVVFKGEAKNASGAQFNIEGDVSGDVDGTNVTITGDVGGDVDGTNVTVKGSVSGDIDGTNVSVRG